MEAISLPIYNTQGQEIENIKLDSSIFDGTVNQDAIYQAVNAFRANQRVGLAATKTRGEVSGGGKKPWKQKGTGRARVGSIRSPLWRHGGVIFGPHPRDYGYTLPQKIRTLALRSSLNLRLKENNLLLLEDLKTEKPRTKDLVQVFSKLKVDIKDKKSAHTLLLLDKIDANLKLSLRNIGFLSCNLASDTQAYEVMAHKRLIVTKSGLDALVKRLK